jgi:hypothetical protein
MKFKFCCLNKKPDEVLQSVGNFPVHECLIADSNWQQHGLAVLYISRIALNCRFVCAFYLVDTYCLGVKNTFAKVNLDRDHMLDFRQQVERNRGLRPYDYEDARSLILGAIDYAGSFGFQPNEDWRDSRHIVEANRAYLRKFKFGKDGKPFYVQGPNDDPKSIMAKLAAVDQRHPMRAY